MAVAAVILTTIEYDSVHAHGLDDEPNAQVEWQLQQQS